MNEVKIIGYACIKNNEFRISLIGYSILENGSLDRENKTEIFWSKNKNLEEILNKIPENLSFNKISIHNGLRFSMKEGRSLTKGCDTLNEKDYERIGEKVNQQVAGV